VTQALIRNEEPPAAFVEAMDQICQKALAQGCRIWVDSEQHAVQTSIDRWTIPFMRKYNVGGTALVYNTLQAYLKSSRSKLQAQLAVAQQEGWTLAIKLVRGAYIDSDPRERIHDTKDDTDNSYNGIVHDLLSGTNLGFSPETMPKVQLFLAGHNPASVGAAIDLMQTLSAAGKLKIEPEFGQLQGMADELGCSVLQRADGLREKEVEAGSRVAVPLVYKCLTWGSVQECMQYLLRRAIENSGGTARMKDGYAAYLGELKRRMGSVLRLRT
jgi:proline dehydrogenase